MKYTFEAMSQFGGVEIYILKLSTDYSIPIGTVRLQAEVGDSPRPQSECEKVTSQRKIRHEIHI